MRAFQLKNIFLISGIGLFLLSCSHLDFLKINDSTVLNKPNQWKAKAVWVKPLHLKDHNGFKKINRFTPYVFNNIIVAASSIDGISGIDLDSKKSIWTLNIPHGVEAAAVGVQDRLFFGSQQGVFYSINVLNGSVIWKFDTESELVSEPLLEDGKVYFISGTNVLYCLDALTGRQLWVYNRQESNQLMTIRGGGRPTILDNVIYQGFSDGSVVALSANRGQLIWESTLNRNTKFKDIDATIVADKDTLYVNSYDDRMYALDKKDGKVVWSSSLSGGASAPFLAGEKLYYSTSSGELYCLNKETGQVIWKNLTLKGVATDPITYKGLLVIGESLGSLKFFNMLTGELVSQFDPGKGVMSRSILVKSDYAKPTETNMDSIFFISGESNLYQIQLIKDSNNYYFPFLN